MSQLWEAMGPFIGYMGIPSGLPRSAEHQSRLTQALWRARRLACTPGVQSEIVSHVTAHLGLSQEVSYRGGTLHKPSLPGI